MVDEKKQSGSMQQDLKPSDTVLANDAPKRTAADHNRDDAPSLTQEAFDTSYKEKRWNETPQGRLAIRTFSRGVLGAMFFTAGGLWARNMLKYDEKNILKPYSEYNAEKTTFHDTIKEKNPLQFIAKVIDTFAGKPIQKTVQLITGSEVKGYNAVHFKPTKFKRSYPGAGIESIRGRSLGEETVFTTFDFFCASIGDAMGRDIAGWIDPTQRKQWCEKLTDKDGGIKWPETVKSLCKTMWRYVSYNGGEDWAVAIPYVYFVRGQRNLIDKHLSQGYGFESDIGMNASSLKINTQTSPHRVAGSYAFEAMLDYQTRFTVYNIGTLMYRELYDKAEQALKYGKHVNLYGTPDAPADPNKGLVGTAVDLVKWAARSTIKGVIYMTPAMPFFSLTRVTQGRGRALFVDPSRDAALAFHGTDGHGHFLTASDINHNGGKGVDGVHPATNVYYAKYNKDANKGYGSIERVGGILEPHIGNPSANPKFDVYQTRYNVIENGFSTLGKWTSNLANSLDATADSLDKKSWFQPVKSAMGLIQPTDQFKRFTRNAVNASMSYMPYMYAKAEFANLWDTGKMDMAAERAIDGAFSGSWKEVKAGAGEIWDAFLHKPFADKVRNEEANRRIKIDSSASDAFSQEEAKRSHQKQIREQKSYDPTVRKATDTEKDANDSHDKLPWLERVVKGREGEHVQAVSTQHSPSSHTEREVMRKWLEEITPPTNSVH